MLSLTLFLPLLGALLLAFVPKEQVKAIRFLSLGVTLVTFLLSLGLFKDFSSYLTVFMVLSLFFWVGTARYVRSLVLQLRERELILAAQALGASTPRILLYHLLPNIAFIVVLQISATLGSVAGTEVALTWFGVGGLDGVQLRFDALGRVASAGKTVR